MEESSLLPGGQDPAPDHHPPRSPLVFAARLPPPCRYYRHTVVRGHLRVRPIDTRLVAASFGDGRLQIVGDDDLGHAPQKLEGAHVGADPVGQTLRASRLGVTVV